MGTLYARTGVKSIADCTFLIFKHTFFKNMKNIHVFKENAKVRIKKTTPRFRRVVLGS